MDKFTLITTVINTLSMLFLGFSAILIWYQTKTGYTWNKNKATQEILNNLVIGSFSDLRTMIEKEFGCKIWDKSETYTEVINIIQTDGEHEFSQSDIDLVLGKILNIFEIVSINLKNKIVDENICYDYLAWIMTAYYRWSKPYIQEKRELTGDNKILINFEKYALKWACNSKSNK